MKTALLAPFALILLFATTSLPGNAAAAHPKLPAADTARIEEITGLKGKLNEKEGAFKVAQPRTDVKIAVDGWAMPPFMGLTSWAAFTPGKKGDLMAMGDLVVFADEVNPVMSALFAHGVDVTALHNHFFFDEPKTYFMHISGEGPAAKLAQGVRAAFDEIKRIRAASPSPARSFGLGDLPEKSAISAAPLEAIFGLPGEARDGMFKVTIGRRAKMACGCEAGKDLGVNTWAAFAGGDGQAVVDGDFAVEENELQPVLRSLREHQINIVAIHSHMTGEKPRILFLHYWGRGAAADLAKAVKAALDATAGGK